MRVCSSRSLSLLRTSARVFPRVRAVEHGLACLCECARLRACLSVLQDGGSPSAREEDGKLSFFPFKKTRVGLEKIGVRRRFQSWSMSNVDE